MPNSQVKPRKKPSIRHIPESVKKQVCDCVKQCKNTREICQMNFGTKENPLKVNPQQIRLIVDENEHGLNPENKDPDSAYIIKQFRKGKTQLDVIEEGYKVEFVKRLWKEFLDIRKEMIVPNWVVENIFEISYDIHACDTFEEAFDVFRSSVKDSLELKKHVYACSRCKKPVPLDGDALKTAIRYIESKGWEHVFHPI